MTGETMTTRQVAAIADMPMTEVYAGMSKGEIPYFRAAKECRIPTWWVENLIGRKLRSHITPIRTLADEVRDGMLRAEQDRAEVLAQCEALEIENAALRSELARYKQMRPTRAQRARIIERDRDHCRYCGRRVNRNTRHIDHVLPVSRGGIASDDNLVVACRRCNLRKGDGLLAEIGWTLIPG